MRRAGLREMAAPARLARLVDDRVEPGKPRDLLGATETACVADLGEQVTGEDRADPVDRLQRLAALIAASETPQLRVDPPEQRPRLHRLGEPNIEAARDELAPHPAPAGRRLDRDS